MNLNQVKNLQNTRTSLNLIQIRLKINKTGNFNGSFIKCPKFE